jgi:hypothetical protein
MKIAFGQMDSEAREATQRIWRELDGADRPGFNPLESMFVLYKVRKLAGANGWENVSVNPYPPIPYQSPYCVLHIDICAVLSSLSMPKNKTACPKPP